MLLIRRIEIENFACFDRVAIEPSTKRDKPLTVIRAENGSGKTTLLRAIRWGMYGEEGLPGNASQFSLHPAEWRPDANEVKTRVSIVFETDGSSRDHPEGNPTNTAYELRRSVATVAREPTRPGEPDFRRIREEAQLLVQEADGSWVPHEAGVDRVIDELLPSDLRDFFVMDADEAADYVGGSENKVIQRQDVIEKTSFSVRALLGLDVFEKAMNRVRKIGEGFGREATKAARDEELSQKQAVLDGRRGSRAKLKERIAENDHKKAEVADLLERARGKLEALVGGLGAHDQLRTRMKETQQLRERAEKQRGIVVSKLPGQVASIELLASLVARELATARDVLQPLYDDGSIPIRHLVFVQSLLDEGICICGQELSSQGDHRRHVEDLVAQSTKKEGTANYLAEVLHAANRLHQYRAGAEWESRCSEYEAAIAESDAEIAGLEATKRGIDSKLEAIDEENVQLTRDEIAMLESQLEGIERDLVSDGESFDREDKTINELQGIIRSHHRRQREARDLETYEETASVVARILDQAFGTIRDDQVRELSGKMNDLFVKMAANVVDDEPVEADRHKATLRMIAKVGLRPLRESSEEFEIFALNRRNRTMPPTEINGASRRILALSFVLALCEVSRTLAPLVADSLLNFMSGSVRTNTLRVTAETASQPILLLTGSDLQSQSEVDLVTGHAGATYTLTGQWQQVEHGGDVVNQTDARQVALVCRCGPREYCKVCEREGQAGSPGWKNRTGGGVRR